MNGPTPFLPCVICKETPQDALIFTADGNYGSTIFDPMSWTGQNAEYLEIVICDECVRKIAPGSVQHVTRSTPHPTFSRETWTAPKKYKPGLPPTHLPDGLWQCNSDNCNDIVAPKDWIQHLWDHAYPEDSNA